MSIFCVILDSLQACHRNITEAISLGNSLVTKVIFKGYFCRVYGAFLSPSGVSQSWVTQVCHIHVCHTQVCSQIQGKASAQPKLPCFNSPKQQQQQQQLRASPGHPCALSPGPAGSPWPPWLGDCHLLWIWHGLNPSGAASPPWHLPQAVPAQLSS